MQKYLLILFSLMIGACSTYQPPPSPDRSNIKPINNEQSFQLINNKVTPHAS